MYTYSGQRPFLDTKNPMVGKIKNYFVEAVGEMKKVVWPTKQQTINYTVLVIILSVGVAMFFGVLDYLLNIGLGWLIK